MKVKRHTQCAVFQIEHYGNKCHSGQRSCEQVLTGVCLLDKRSTLPPSGLARLHITGLFLVKNFFLKCEQERKTTGHNVLEEDVIHLLLNQLLKSKRRGKGLKKSLHYLIKYY